MKKSFTAKVSRIMKICVIQVFLAFTLSGLCIANVNYAQVLETRITVDLQNVPFELALQEIGSKAKVSFSYSHEGMAGEKPVTLLARDTRLGTILEELFVPRDITYQVHSKNNLITIKKKNREVDRQESVLLDDIREVVPARHQGRITGTITDVQTGTPMPGVNIIVKGTTRGTTTDKEGVYGIDADPDDVLVFSFIGYASEERRVGEQTRIDIGLMEDIRGLDEVTINAGYYKTNKETQTGSIVRVTADDIARQPVMNPLAALQAIVPGMQVVQETGVPGGNFTVRIRGQNSIGSGNDPLYIINGVPFTSVTMSNPYTSDEIFSNGTNPLNMLNPADIASIEVLKDADATSIYGARGGNGVILITTKKGEAGKTRVNASYSGGIGQVAGKLNLMDTREYVAMRKEAFKNDGLWPVDPSWYPFIPEVFVWDTTRYTNWQKEFIGGSARTNDAQFSVSGGSDQLTFIFGGAYHSETTVFPGNNKDERYSGHLNINHTSLNKKFTANVALNYTVNDAKLINEDLTGVALTLAPNAPPVRNADGSLYWSEDAWNAFFRNPLAYTETGYENVTNNLVANAVLDYAFLPGLHLKTNLGYTNVVSDGLNTTPLTFYYPPLRASRVNGATFSESSFRNWVFEPQLNWQFHSNRLKIDALLGSTFLDQEHKAEAFVAEDFPVDALLKNPRAAAHVSPANFTHAIYRYSSVFARVNFNWRSRYIMNVTGRRDGSSRFGPGRQFANFGAVGLGWVASNEPFFQSLDHLVTHLKVRTSYGLTGNDQIADYQYLDTYTPSDPYGDVSTLLPARLSNPDFAWETNEKFEVAIDFSLWKNRLAGVVSYYHNLSDNQLVGTPLPPTSGFSSTQSNFDAVVLNSGWEFMLTFQKIGGADFGWKSSVNLTIPRNELLEFPGIERSPQFSRTLIVGEPLNIRKLYHNEGVDVQTGLYNFRDYNDDGILDYEDRRIVGHLMPEYYGGFQNVFSYHGFELSLLLQFSKRDAISPAALMGPPGGANNQTTAALQRWRREGEISSYQKYTAIGAGVNLYSTFYQNSDQSMVDGSFIRLKNVSLSYSFEPSIVSKLGMQHLRLFASGQNLLTFTSFPGLDPESGVSALPPLRVVTGGINIGF